MIDHKSLLLCCSTVALSSISFATLAAQTAAPATLSALDAQCYVPPPAPLDVPATENNQQIAVRSEHALSKNGEYAEFDENVAAAQGEKRMHSDKAHYNRVDQEFVAEGNVKYQDSMVNLHSNRVQANMKTNETTIGNAHYQFTGQNGRGHATHMHMNPDNSMTLRHASFTVCPPGDESWRVSAKTIDIDKDHDWAVAHHAVFRIHDVPVLYTPYFSYPISDKRQTGFLYPSFSTASDTGFDLATPFYWNMAPNYDLTVTPRYMAKRGTELSGSFRYLKFGQLGELDYDHLGSDQEYHEERRYLFHWRNDGHVGPHWRMHGDYTQVSDPNFFSDIGSEYASDADQLRQTGSVDYMAQNWNAGIMANDYQIMGNWESPHKVLPELHFDGLWDTGFGPLQFGMRSQLVRFTHRNNDIYTGQRYHFEPSLKLPLELPGGFINSEIALMQTYYNQKTRGYSQLDDHVSRTIPKYKVEVGLNFDRSFTFLDERYQQTFEPRVQYLYIPYKNQDNIGIYDSTALEQDYFGMFRDTRYSGLDRISNGSQITAGATTRFLNSKNEEKMRLAIAQIFYFKKNQVELDEDDTFISRERYEHAYRYRNVDGDGYVDESRSALAIEGDLNISHDWFFHTGMQISQEDNDFNKANAALEWHPETNKIAQINYRYGKPNGTLREKIDQIGSKLSWPLRPDLQFIGSYYRDLNLNEDIESLVGLQYDSCCWAFQISLQRKVNRHYDRDGDIDEGGDVDKSINFKFLLKGIGATDNSDNYRKMMDSGRLPYGHPFYLND